MKGFPVHRLHVWRSTKHISATALLIALTAIILIGFAYYVKADVGSLFAGLTTSFIRVSVAYIAALFAAVVLGILVTHSTYLEDVSLPILDVAQSIPTFALLPLLVKEFGEGSVPVVLIVFLNIVWPVLFAVVGGIKTLHSDLGEAATVFGAVGWKRIWNFTLPGLFPAIITGSIIGWGAGWEAIAGAEIIGSKTGIGIYIQNVTNAGQTNLIILAFVMLLFVVFLVNNWIWLRLLRRMTKWEE
jgi:NitT/TauT family transport system permease protein